ncbi:hypothetical protein PGT21_036790 [Puccinia graminis f. sp. tritici]|uniref:Uncharacterized protein n=1 Tax=Puccinia graminis f. sp. tritici TaxID=56615 RepID=A0A5B0P5J2_PUCGR|nr:hypothetical protein PGT21_036790 [Puccinia graminis f. sp. tritici]
MPPEPVDGLPILLRMRQEQERSNLDEGDLWAENTKLQNDLNKLKQKERKMLQADNLVQKQLLYSEEQRYQLEAKLAAATDDCHSKTKLLDESSKQLRLAKLQLDLMVSNSDSDFPSKEQGYINRNKAMKTQVNHPSAIKREIEN